MTYFDARHLPEAKIEIVAWLDVMGIQSAVTRSISVAANFVFKLHVAALEARSDHISLYPVMDGVYICAPTEQEMATFLRAVLAALCKVFISEENPRFQFIVRGAVAKGPVHHGRDLGRDASVTLTKNPDYRAQILLGRPMIDAHVGEPKAPPFGVFVDASARGVTFPITKEGWWPWFDGFDKIDSKALAAGLSKYCDWCYAESENLKYEPERVHVHRGFSEAYFGR